MTNRVVKSPPAVLDIPFRLRDRVGTVHVEVTANDDPEELGHGLVAIGYDPPRFHGFPVLTAALVYAGRGARAWMGWVQVIERHDDSGDVVASVDGPPIFEGSPLYTFGYLPTLSDFPANPDHPDGDWIAEAFLVAVPDVVHTRLLFPVVGFRWGYRLFRSRPVELFAPEHIGLDQWEHHRQVLESSCPAWTFMGAESA